MDTTAELAHRTRAPRRRSRIRKWGTRFFAVAALAAAIGSVAVVTTTDVTHHERGPIPADLAR
jgi:hypothetical protein